MDNEQDGKAADYALMDLHHVNGFWRLTVKDVETGKEYLYDFQSLGGLYLWARTRDIDADGVMWFVLDGMDEWLKEIEGQPA